MRVVVINLDRSPERLATFRAEAERVGLAFERLPAVEAEAVAERHGRLTRGEVGCFESHRAAWRSLVESGDPWLAVFEDDAVLAAAVTGFLAAPERFPAGADLIKIEAYPDRVTIGPRALAFDGFALHPMRSRHRGSAGYVLSRRAAMSLLERTEGYRRAIDMMVFDPREEAVRGLRILQAVPGLCIQEHLLAERAGRPPLHSSLIEHSNAPAEPRPATLVRRLSREIRRLARQLAGRARAAREMVLRSRQLVVPFLGS